MWIFGVIISVSLDLLSTSSPPTHLEEGGGVVHACQTLQLATLPPGCPQPGPQALQAAPASRRRLPLLSPDAAAQRLQASLQGVDDAHDGALAVVHCLSGLGLKHGHTMVNSQFTHSDCKDSSSHLKFFQQPFQLLLVLCLFMDAPL